MTAASITAGSTEANSSFNSGLQKKETKQHNPAGDQRRNGHQLTRGMVGSPFPCFPGTGKQSPSAGRQNGKDGDNQIIYHIHQGHTGSEASPALEIIIVSAIPTVMARICSIISGRISFFKDLLENIALSVYISCFPPCPALRPDSDP